MIDRIMAIVGLLMLLAFISVIPIFVPHPDLIVVTLGCAALAGYDVWRSVIVKRR